MTARWRNFAACLDQDPELHYPDGTTGRHLIQIEEAKAVCRSCWVRDLCLEDAMRAEGSSRRDSRHGIRGALTSDERYALYKRHSRQKTAA